MTTQRVTTRLLLVLLLVLLGAPAAAQATPHPDEWLAVQAEPTEPTAVDPELDATPADPTQTLPVEPTPTDTAPPEPAPDEEASSETGSTETTPTETTPGTPAPVMPGPAEPPPPAPKPRPKRRRGAERPAEPSPEQPVAPLAENTTRTVQVIVQVQVGCRHHCEGTTQSQTAIQDARIDQTAIAPDGTARNDSVIEQYVWQLQLGCVAFCAGTVQTQTVEQRAQTTQTAIGGATVNGARTVQVTQQRQRGRRGRARTLLAGLDGLLRDLARETSATIQVIRQIQVADCLHHCTGDTQVQLAVQHAVTAQEAAARSLEGID